MTERRRTLLLDLDGTLADSLGVLRDSYLAFLATYGIDRPKISFDRINGPRIPEIVEMLRKEHELPASSDELVLRYGEMVDANYMNAPPMPGALNLLRSAAARKWSIAIVTSNSRARASGWLRSKRLDSYIAEIFGSESADRGKPFPDLYLAAIAALESDPGDCCAVEDSRHGACAAIAAGIRTFHLVNPGLKHDVAPGAIGVSCLEDVMNHLGLASC